MIASSAGRGARVEVGILVKRNSKAGVPIAKDISTFAAVMASNKVAKCTLTCWIITNGRFNIGLIKNKCAVSMRTF